MHQIKAYTITFSCLAFICLLGVFYHFWYAQDIGPSDKSMASSQATTGVSKEAYLTKADPAKLGFVQPTLFVNYSILPDIEGTRCAKRFFENLHAYGNIGRNNVFQEGLSQLTISQVLANLLLKPNVHAHLNTVGLSPNMLSTEQIKACYVLSKALMRDLKKMYKESNCTDEQITVINTALGRLAFLNNSFRQELDLYHAYDPIELEENSQTVKELLQKDRKYQLVINEVYEHYSH